LISLIFSECKPLKRFTFGPTLEHTLGMKE
jgi:hypothetical protein